MNFFILPAKHRVVKYHVEIILSEAHPGDFVVLMPMVSSVILSLYLGKSSWASETD